LSEAQPRILAPGLCLGLQRLMAGIVEPKACCTLYDESGLPAGPIELPIEPAR